MARFRKRRSFGKKRRGFQGRSRRTRNRRGKRSTNRYTISRGGIRL